MSSAGSRYSSLPRVTGCKVLVGYPLRTLMVAKQKPLADRIRLNRVAQPNHVNEPINHHQHRRLRRRCRHTIERMI